AADWNQIRRLLNTTQPHVIALQETLSSRLEAIPESWRTRHDGRLAIASCYPIAEFRSWCPEQPRQPWSRVVAVYARLDTPDGPVGVCNVHLMPPHEALANLFDPQEHFTVEDRARLTQQNLERNRESESLAEWIRNLPQLDVVLGGFNMPVESCIYRRWWKSYHNAYSRVGFGTGSTITRKWHNIRFGTRVDHVLTTDNWSPTACQVGPDIGSDHRPVTATLAREG
ncbi:MAG: endonuclease/exonuclease/phosphatase family protein, partial [Planctomycetota bacterium]